jgi:formylglycine-generating enzyme required for sulfatase activity
MVSKASRPSHSFAQTATDCSMSAANVWEWTSDWYRSDYYSTLAAQGGIARNPHGPASSLDPSEPDQPKRVQRGGSFLCTDEYLHPLHGRHTRQG